MIRAFPFNMSYTLPIHHSFLFADGPQRGLPHEDAFILSRRIGKAFSSLAAIGRGLLKLNQLKSLLSTLCERPIAKNFKKNRSLQKVVLDINLS